MIMQVPHEWNETSQRLQAHACTLPSVLCQCQKVIKSTSKRTIDVPERESLLRRSFQFLCAVLIWIIAFCLRRWLLSDWETTVEPEPGLASFSYDVMSKSSTSGFRINFERGVTANPEYHMKSKEVLMSWGAEPNLVSHTETRRWMLAALLFCCI